jgi:DNA-binding MarR family transcriptional regulator
MDTSLPAIARRPTFIVHRINAELARICNPLFRRLGVDLITSRILAILLEQNSAYVGDIVELMALPQSTVSHQIKRLETAGLITRKTDKADNRAYFVALTRKGKAIAEQCSHISASLYRQIFDGLAEEEMQQLASQLEQMDARLKTLSAADLNL